MEEPLDLRRYRAFLIDLDGVLVWDGEPIPGAAEALTALKRLAPVVILSNNSTRSRRAFALELRAKGFPVSPREVVNSAYVVAQHLRREHGPVAVFAIGETGLFDELERAGHQLVEPERAQFVVVGLDRDFHYGKLTRALRALLGGARLIAANADPTFPTPEGPIPGAGALVGAIRGLGYEPEAVVGKPNPIAFRVALSAVDVEIALSPKDALMIGDRLDTDVEGAARLGMEAALVLTGVTTPDDLERWTGPRPAHVARSLKELVERGLRRSQPSG